MIRVWFSVIVLMVLPACETSEQAVEPAVAIDGWNTSVDAAKKADTPDCLRKTNVIEAWECFSKNPPAS